LSLNAILKYQIKTHDVNTNSYLPQKYFSNNIHYTFSIGNVFYKLLQMFCKNIFTILGNNVKQPKSTYKQLWTIICILIWNCNEILYKSTYLLLSRFYVQDIYWELLSSNL
jgi:hypothetical protein